MATHGFVQVDVFTRSPLYGNPVAVVLDAEGIDTADMQRLAAWTNLSETAFVLPPTQSGADYRLRIFTPAHELPFAGHPTVGAAHAVLQAGIVRGDAAHLTQECGAGLLALRTEGSGPERRIFVRVPEAKILRDRAVDVDVLGRALGAPVVADSHRDAAMPSAVVALVDGGGAVGRACAFLALAWHCGLPFRRRWVGVPAVRWAV